jgi:hypothetical protein
VKPLIQNISRHVEERIESATLEDLNIAVELLVRSIRSRIAHNGASELFYGAFLLSPAGRKERRAKHRIATGPPTGFKPPTIPQPAILVGNDENETMNYAPRDHPEAMMAA